MTIKALLVAGAAAAALLTNPLQASAAEKLLNASYDIARELFVEVNEAFIADYKAKTGKDVTIDQSHAGSSKQARAILEGMEADVVTFNQTTDINALVKGGAVSPDWVEDFPNRASPIIRYQPSWCAKATRRTSRTGAISSVTTSR